MRIKSAGPVVAVVLAHAAAAGAQVTVSVDANANRKAISPLIYGVHFAESADLLDMNATINRLGGNSVGRYNYLRDIDNRGGDYYFLSFPYSSNPPVIGGMNDDFITKTKAGGAEPYLSMAMVGHVATTDTPGTVQFGFPITGPTACGAQTGSDGADGRPNAGNGCIAGGFSFFCSSGHPLVPPSLPGTCDPISLGVKNVLADGAFQQGWMQHVRDTFGPGSTTGLRYWGLDNEPSIWHNVYWDVHPVPADTNEMRDKMIDYAGRIKTVDPSALVLGPEEWGWDGYFYSGLDQKNLSGVCNFGDDCPDRAAHGHIDYVAYLLDQMRQADVIAGRRSLDFFTLHFYPQSNEFSSDVSAGTQALRNKSTRSLWDPIYVDQSYINDTVKLIPRMKDWVNNFYPSTKTGLTEYDWGADTHINGATAEADLLGIFGREGLDMALKWNLPGTGTPVRNAFKMYRNYDGAKSTFGDTSVWATVPNPDNLAAFAAQRGNGALTIMVVNKVAATTNTTVSLANFTPTGTAQVWQLLSPGNAISHPADIAFAGNSFMTSLPGQSITLFVVSGSGGGGGTNADLAITKTDGQTTAMQGQTVTYTIVATNNGPDAVTGATVTDNLPAELTGATWTCVGALGGNCGAANGVGNISQLVNLPNLASVTYTLSALLSANPASLSNTATIAVPGGVTDPNLSNNSATDTDTQASQGLIIYDDALENNFLDYSYGSPLPDFNSTAQAHGGTKSIAFTGNLFNAVSFDNETTTFTTTQYPTLHFWVHGGTAGNQHLRIHLELGGTDVANAVLDSYISGGALVAGAWREVTVPLGSAPLSYSGSYNRIDLQSDQAAAQPVLYIDDVSLVPPAAPPPAGVLAIDRDVTVGGMVSDRFTWQDGIGQPRVAVLAHNDGQTGPGGTRGGELREFRYETPGGTRVVSAASTSSASGFGYVVSHPIDDVNRCLGGDSSSFGHFTSGTFTRIFEGRHHAIFRFQQDYPRLCATDATPPAPINLPVTIDWVFATGRDNPLWAITYDLNGIPVNKLQDDARAPYGELLFDGAASEGAHSPITGVGWGDRYKFASTTNPVTYNSAWTWNTPNTVPYVKLWTTAVSATMGTVQTQTIVQQDAGGYFGTDRWNTTSAGGNACAAGLDSGAAHLMPCSFNWPYQSVNYSMGAAIGADDNVGTNNTRLAWGTNFGFLGQSQYLTQGSASYGGPLSDTFAPGWPRKSYSTYVVLGRHSDSPVEAQVTQVETVQTLALAATIGSVATSGPAGVNRVDNITYAPAGYNPVYGALSWNASGNLLDANIAVGTGTLKKPLLIIRNYTAALPTVKLGGVTLAADVDYFLSLRAAASELWITLNRDLSGPTNHLELVAGGGGPTNADLAITKTDGQTTATPGQIVTYTIVATNNGPADVTGATVTDNLPAELTGATWTCAGTGTCTASGGGSISELVNLPNGASVTYTLSALLSANPVTLMNTATITAPGGVTDTNLSNNSATDADTLLCFGESVIVPDGRFTSSTIADSTTAWFGANLRLGSSYSLEFKNTTGTTPPGMLTVYAGDDGCGNGASTAVTRDTTVLDPQASTGAVRVSFTAAGADRHYRAKLFNSSILTVPFSFRWSDTTLFSPAWSTNGAFNTFYSFQNTTNGTVTGALTLLDTAGATVATFINLSIPSGQTLSTNTSSLVVTRNRTGTARFTHDGPPGAVLATAAIANFTISPAYVQPVKFQAVRETR